MEAVVLELGRQFPADVVQDDCAVDVDGVAGEAGGGWLVDDDSFRRWVESLNRCER